MRERKEKIILLRKMIEENKEKGKNKKLRRRKTDRSSYIHHSACIQACDIKHSRCCDMYNAHNAHHAYESCTQIQQEGRHLQ